MSEFFGREYELLIGSGGGFLSIPRSFTGLRCSFSLIKTSFSSSNAADIKIYNLSKESRNDIFIVASLKDKVGGSRITLNAGYDGNIDLVFQGELVKVDHIKSGADWVTSMQCRDSYTKLSTTRIDESFVPGTPMAAVLATLFASFDAPPPNLAPFADKLATQVFQNGYTASGLTKDVLDKLFEKLGGNWSFQNGIAYATREGIPLIGELYFLTSSTGLVGTPTVTEKGIKFRTLLLPKMKPGALVTISTFDFPLSVVIVKKIAHVGDTHDQAWYNEVEGVAA